MKRFISLSLLSVLMMVSMPQKSHALVGLLLKKNAVTVIGGATTGASAIAFGVGGATMAGSTSAVPLLLTFFGSIGAVLGLVILDDDNAEFKFPLLTIENSEKLGISSFEMDTYNSELNKLNRVKESIEEQMTADSTISDAKIIWSNICGQYVSTETCEVKGIIANDFMNNLKTIK